MPRIPTMSERKARFSGLLVPITIVFGVCVLLLMPNLIMHASSGGAPKHGRCGTRSSRVLRYPRRGSRGVTGNRTLGVEY